MKKPSYLPLIVATLAFAGCSSDVEVSEPVVEKPAVEITTLNAENPGGDGPQTFSLNGVITDSEKGGTLTGPSLEQGGVLYINKTYSFKYVPANTHPYQSNASFIEVAIGVSNGGGYDPEYTIDRRTSITMNHTFAQPGTYTVKGNAVYFWLETSGGMLPTAYKHYGEVYQSAQYNVVDPISMLIISGTDSPSLNINTTYSVPSALPAGITFINWGNITPASHVITGGTSSQNLAVKFTAYGTYTLSANFRLSNGATYTATRTVQVLAPIPPAPSLVSSGSLLSATEASWAGFYAGEPVYWITPTATSATVTVDSGANFDSSATYEWRFDPRLSVRYSMPYYIGFYIPALGSGAYPRRASYRVECRASKNGQYSAWSSLGLFVSDAKPTGPYRLTEEESLGVDSLKTTPPPVEA